MTTAAQALPRSDLARTAAEAAAEVLPAGGTLTIGDPLPAWDGALPDGQAVCAKFTGAAQGSVAVVVGADLVEALRNSPLGELDLAKAVTPALEAAAGVFGPVVVEPGQALEPDTGLISLAGQGEPLYVPLLDGDAIRAVLGLVAAPWPQGAAASAAPGTDGADAGAGAAAQERQAGATGGQGVRPAVRNAGLDLLHDVEMNLTAELGRTSMAVRDLLSLVPGAVVELDRTAGSPADLLVNGRLIARGEVVVIDENFGIRITEILPPASGPRDA